MERLKELRKAKGLTQQQVADAIGIQRELYVRYENGSRRPPIENLTALADFFAVSIDDMIGRTVEPPAKSDELSELARKCAQLDDDEKKLVAEMIDRLLKRK